MPRYLLSRPFSGESQRPFRPVALAALVLSAVLLLSRNYARNLAINNKPEIPLLRSGTN